MKFTIVIPVAPERDAEIIKSLKELDYPKSDFHVIVVKGKNPSENRNKGVEKAKGNFIVFLDDDAKIRKDYLLKVDEFFKHHPEIDIVGGPQLTPEDDNLFAKISGYALKSYFGAWKITKRYSVSEECLDADETCLTSANLICRKDVLKNIRFDPSLFPGEDPKFISDAKRYGFKVGYSPSIVVFHKRRKNFQGFAKQIFNYGKGRPLKENFFETLKMPFFLVPSLFLIYISFLVAIIFLNPFITGKMISFNISNKFSLLFIPLILYIFLMLIFGFYDSINNKDYKSLWILPFIYITIHLSYGSGMIFGYFKKLKDKLVKLKS